MHIRLIFVFIAISYAKPDNRVMDQLVDSTMRIVSNELNQRVSRSIDQIDFPTDSFEKTFSKYVKETLTNPTLAEERLMIINDVQVLQEKQFAHPLKAFKSLAKKIIQKIQLNTQKWVLDQKNIMTSKNIKNTNLLSKRASNDDVEELDNAKSYRFPHLFEDNSALSMVVDQFFWIFAIAPVQSMVFVMGDSIWTSSFYLWLLQNFMIQPFYNRLMYGYYLYKQDKVEYY